MNIKIRITGIKDDVHEFVERLKVAGGDYIVSCSRDYPQTRYDKNSKEVAVYLTVNES